jgi:hypothetical protein
MTTQDRLSSQTLILAEVIEHLVSIFYLIKLFSIGAIAGKRLEFTK